MRNPANKQTNKQTHEGDCNIPLFADNKTITTILKSFDTFVVIATTSSSITLSLTGITLIAVPVSIVTACGLSIGDKILYEIIVNKYSKLKWHSESADPAKTLSDQSTKV